MSQRRAIILDRDGTIIVERHYLSRPEQVELLPGAAAGLRRLRNRGYPLVVVTNQSGIGRQYYTEADLARVHERLCHLLAAAGVELDGIYHCPHRPEQRCKCRKPQTALVEQASAELSFDSAAAIVIGDKPCDIELARALGARSILVRTGYGATFASDPAVTPDFIVDDLTAAAELIESFVEDAVSASRPTPS